MLFNSLQFVFFFLVVTGLYFLLPYRFRWLLLLIASCYFYMAFVPVYILILGFTIVIDYYAGLLIESSQGSRRVWWLRASIFANVGVLALFKYYNFLNDNLSSLLQQMGYGQTPIPYLTILLPIGLSFHTFQAMSYTIEVYRGNQKAERHFGIYALYVMFYPQLVAGPIERPQNILHQFYEKHDFDYDRVVGGLRLMAWGFFKKVVIADRISLAVDAVYNQPGQYGAVPLLVATVLFAIQIYCDFSGYSDIAIGSARVMGFRLMRNFRSPYFSRSVSEFWTRWHISLSTWFRDYLYIPLGGNRVSTAHRYANLMITFLVSGLWHGASWTYVIWGGLNGLYIILDSAFGRPEKETGQTSVAIVGRVFLTFVLICSTWLFFRANTLQDAGLIVGRLCSISTYHIRELVIFKDVLSSLDLLIVGLSIGLLFSVEFIEGNASSGQLLRRQKPIVKMAVYYCFLLAILLFGKFQTNDQFIYFQF